MSAASLTSSECSGKITEDRFITNPGAIPTGWKQIFVNKVTVRTQPGCRRRANNNNMGGKIPKLSALRGFVIFFPPFLSATLSECWRVSRTVHYYHSLEGEMGRYAWVSQIAGLNNSWIR